MCTRGFTGVIAVVVRSCVPWGGTWLVGSVCDAVYFGGGGWLAMCVKCVSFSSVVAKMGDSVVSFRPQHYQDDTDLIQGMNQDGVCVCVCVCVRACVHACVHVCV